MRDFRILVTELRFLGRSQKLCLIIYSYRTRRQTGDRREEIEDEQDRHQYLSFGVRIHFPHISPPPLCQRDAAGVW